jgi:hypothetical protein
VDQTYRHFQGGNNRPPEESIRGLLKGGVFPPLFLTRKGTEEEGVVLFVYIPPTHDSFKETPPSVQEARGK